MEQSADSIREVRRRETSRRITHCARVLTDEHGIDGFTMADLATTADVSRRTLFNYFPGKDAAVLGEKPPPDEALLDTFRQGGPTGDLVDDLVALVVAVLDTADFDRDEVALLHRVMHDNPRLIALTKEDFEASGEMIPHARSSVREGADVRRHPRPCAVPGDRLARSRLALDHYLEHPDEDLVDLFNARSALSGRPSSNPPHLPTPQEDNPHGNPALPDRQDRLPAVADLPRRLDRGDDRCQRLRGHHVQADDRRFSIPGIPSEQAADLQAELFPGSKDAFDEAGVSVVVAAPEGHTLDEPTYRAAVDDLIADLADGPQMPAAETLANPVDADADLRQQLADAADSERGPPADTESDADALSTAVEGRPRGADLLPARRRDQHATWR